MNLRILYQDENLIAVDKPAGFHVHPPEDPAHRISRMRNCLHLLRRQTNAFVYPVHRLDRATSGVLLFALQQDVAAKMSAQFRDRQVNKTYFAVVRGWLGEAGTIDRPLRSRKSGTVPHKEARTDYWCLAKIEVPSPVGKYATARYSLVRAAPLTGRMHQIRRHFARTGHPLLGDRLYGDGKHNRFFVEKLGYGDLWLKAHSLEFRHPVTLESVRLTSRWNERWHRIFDLFGVCPLV